MLVGGLKAPGLKWGPSCPSPIAPLLTQWACTAQFCTKTAASISLRVTFHNFLDVFKGITPNQSSIRIVLGIGCEYAVNRVGSKLGVIALVGY